MGYVFQNNYNSAEEFINKALQKNPANALAYSLRVRIAPASESIESVLEQIPPAYHDSPDVLVALGEAALRRGLYDKARDGGKLLSIATTTAAWIVSKLFWVLL
jgi:uncharacterized protein HemY